MIYRCAFCKSFFFKIPLRSLFVLGQLTIDFHLVTHLYNVEFSLVLFSLKITMMAHVSLVKLWVSNRPTSLMTDILFLTDTQF